MTDFREFIADRASSFLSGGMREMFQLAANLKDPVNLAIGQADFDVPPSIKQAIHQAVDENHNDYALAQGIAPLVKRIQQQVDDQFAHQDRQVFITSGTSAGLNLAVLTLINPGEELIYFDPYFAMYPALGQITGGVSVKIDTYPEFQVDIDQVESAITERTKLLIVNSPANPTGYCLPENSLKDLADLARRHNLMVISDEIYSSYSYDRPHRSIAEFYPSTIVIDGFSKSHAMAGLRLAYVHGPSKIIEAMIQLQQFTFVCAPHPVQWAGLAAIETEMSEFVSEYQKKRDWLVDELSSDFEIAKPGGAFYVFPKLPWGSGREFFEAALAENLILIPGKTFSEQDSHFRISYAVPDNKLQQGAELLKKLARKKSATASS